VNRLLLVVAPALAVALSACSLPDVITSDDDAGSVSAVGVRFEAPEGFQKIGNEELTAAANSGNQEDLADLAETTGMDPQTLVQVLRTVDLYLVGDESGPGYVENISVADVPGTLPGAKAIKAQFRALGAKVGEIGHGDTDLGEVTTARVTMTVGEIKVQAEAILVDAGGTVIITVSTTERDRTSELADQVLDTLDEE
jgi:hypothetical protein